VFSTARAGLILLGAAVACGQNGAVHLQIELPDDRALSPASEDLARLTLVTEIDGGQGQITSREVSSTVVGTQISFGDVAIDAGVHLSLLAFAASGRLIGYGRALAPIAVTSDAELAVTIPLRRPFAYVSGGPALLACDTTVDPGQPFASAIADAAQPVAVAATPDGAAVIAVGAGQLRSISTARHAGSGAAPIPLAAGAFAVAVSPDSRWAVVVHRGATSGMSIVDLGKHGAGAPEFVPIDGPAGVAVSADTAYVLTNASDDCTAQSTIVPVTLATAAAGANVGLAGAARDVALAPDGKTLLVAEPCANAIVAVSGGGATQVKVVQVPSPTDVAVIGSRVWGAGRDMQNGAHLVVASANVDGSAPAHVDLPLTQELAKSNDLTEAGQVTEVRLDADQVDGYSLSVLPDGQRVSLLVHATYHAAPIVRPVEFNGVIFDETIVPSLSMETYEYQLIDVTTGVATQRLRTSCSIDWAHNTAVLDDWSCASALGQNTTDTDFIAGEVTVLYGAR
jgi:hypothetical protein